MKQYIFTIICLMSAAFLSACNDDKEAKPYIPDYEIVPQYTDADTWIAYEAFNQYLLDNNKYIYKASTANEAAVDRNNGAAAIWCQPIYWDMAINAYKRAKAESNTEREQKYKTLADRLFAGNKAHYANFDFDDNNTNTGWFIYDDIMWWTISLARAYEEFGVGEYLDLSEKSFGRVWYGSEKVGDTGSYADPEKGLGGGMFWQWQPIQNPRPNEADNGKMACINFPTVVAALTLYNNVPEGRTESSDLRPVYQTKEQYLEKGKEIYDWAVNNLVDISTGQVADSRHGNGNPAWKDHVYNQATYIGASILLYKATKEQQYLDNAVMAADYTMKTMSGTFDLLPFESGVEQGIYTAIFAQYIAMLVYDCGQEQYIPFIRRNINYGWANRDKTRDICGGDYTKAVVEGDAVESYAASGIPALMLLFPVDK
ncbi:glycoside hydrolase family 76 protein [Proteiniphilum sp. UBA5384]|uniref:glycoside hydrolase family 76 protein n=1 Tax=Proteiniphilum sp. UBA5384 TaxID=1947279 RepID=UPI0025FF90C6|nr:glycoside hydrolase family 76 protein [Proteiniphilum sp. UBA5384]